MFACYCFAVVYLLHFNAAANPCDDYSPLSDEGGLLSNQSASRQPYGGHESLALRWYRIISPAGGDMPTSCVDIRHCNTYYPIWLDGKIPPDDGSVHDVKAVMTTTDCDSPGIIQPNVRVKNCGKYRVYSLRPTSQHNGNPSGYCFGMYGRCPPGTGSDTGWEPRCWGPVLNLKENPILRFKLNWTAFREREVSQFTCNIEDNTLPNGTLYEREWYITKQNGDVIQLPFTNATKITEKQLFNDAPGDLNYKLQCKAKARHPTYAPSNFTHSGKYFIGIEITPPEVTISPGDTNKFIRLEPTIPVICYDGSNCVFTIGIHISDNIKPLCQTPKIDFSTSDCNVKIKGLLQDEDRFPFEQFSVKTASGGDQELEGDQSNMVVVFRSDDSSAYHPFWSEKVSLPLPVRALEDKRNVDLVNSVCHATNDPHMRSFDGCIYEAHLPGEFIMYRNTYYGNQVSLFTKKCGSRAFCNCGAAVLAGKTQFIIDRCKDDKTLHRNDLLRCDDHSMKIRERNSYFQIELRTGTIVEIDDRYGYITIYIKPSTKDIGFAEGLCGNLDLSPENDLYNRDNKSTAECKRVSTWEMPPATVDFLNSWRVNSGESLWNEHLPTVNHTYQLCGCNQKIGGAVATCKKESDWLTVCTPERAGKDVTGNYTQRCWEKSDRKKRATGGESDYGDLARPPFTYDNPPPYQEPTWPSNGFTEKRARNVCEFAVFGSKTGETCQTVAGVQYNSSVEQCMQDIKLSGGERWVQDAVGVMAASCENQVTRNLSLWTVPEGGGKPAPPANITEAICPADCSGHGLCVKGVCSCNSSYAGEECSINMENAPAEVQTTGDCDLSRRPCKAVAIFASGLLDSSKLACRVQVVDVTSTGNIDVGAAQVYPAEYLDRTKVMCPLPVTGDSRAKRAASQKLGHGYTISVSNDNKTFSNETSLLAFNPTCVECIQGRKCSLKNNTCLIDGNCFEIGAKRHGAECYECVPAKSTSFWTWTEGCVIGGDCYDDGSTNIGAPCLTCNSVIGNDAWTLVDNTCYIDRNCYVNEELNPRDICYMCNSTVPRQWSPKGSDICRQTRSTTPFDPNTTLKPLTEKNSNSLIIGLAIGGAILMFAVAVIAISVYQKKAKLHRKTNPIIGLHGNADVKQKEHNINTNGNAKV